MHTFMYFYVLLMYFYVLLYTFMYLFFNVKIRGKFCMIISG